MRFLNYGVIDWFFQPKNRYDLAAAYDDMQPPTMPQETISKGGKLNYGLVDCFKRPPRYGIDLANAFAPAELEKMYYPNTTVSPYPTRPPNLNKYEQAAKEAAEINFLNATPNRVVF